MIEFEWIPSDLPGWLSLTDTDILNHKHRRSYELLGIHKLKILYLIIQIS